MNQPLFFRENHNLFLNIDQSQSYFMQMTQASLAEGKYSLPYIGFFYPCLSQVTSDSFSQLENIDPKLPIIVKKCEPIEKERLIDVQKEILSAKKNSSSNIINQFFSYFSCR